MKTSSGGQKTTVWFVVGFLVVATVAVIIAAVVSSGSLGGSKSGLSDKPAPAIAADDWTKGPKDAKVTLIEYGDFECPACGQYEPLVEKLLQDYKDKVLFVFRNFPLYSIHPNAGIGAQAAEAAGLQGKYWEMHDILYQKQGEWAEAATDQVVAQHFDGYAQSIGLDVNKFNQDINSDPVLKKIKKDVDGGNAVDIGQTPTFYVNLKQIQNPASYDEFKSILNAALAA